MRLLAALFTITIAQAQIDPLAIEQTVLAELKSANIPGAAIGIVQDHKLVYAKGFGVSSIETGAPVTPEMLFRLGSTTKMLTAAAVVSLPIDLNAPVGRYIRGLDPAIAELTANQLLSHTAGLKDEAVMNGRHDDAALGEEIHQWKAAEWLFTKPGKIHSYSNPGFWLAGYLAEVVAGKPYADVMAERVFKPLGMERTTLRPTMAMTWPFSQGHDMIDNRLAVLRPAPDNTANWPAGSAFSNLNDLSRFVAALMDGTHIDRRLALLTTPHADIPGAKTRYGYGLIIDRRIWTHSGSRAGYGSNITIAPGTGTAIIVLCNRTGANLPKTRQALMRMLGINQPEEPTLSAVDISRYAGDYRNGKTTIRIPGETEGIFPVLGPDGKPEFIIKNERAFARQ
jgi:CubicO group peptidase (beta-lactamase class C family)